MEKITGRSYDIIVSDWNEGLEAAFLLKTVAGTKGQSRCFHYCDRRTLEAADAAREAGADLVLSRPLAPESD